jgi:hypothetical protein
MERIRAFEHLRIVAERIGKSLDLTDEQRVLFASQSYYRIGWDRSRESTAWLEGRFNSRLRKPEALLSWSDDWLVLRALSLALANHGDPEPLRYFVRSAQLQESVEIANLNYWAYWLGELKRRQHSLAFMASRDVFASWTGVTVIRHLATRLHCDNPDLELNIHTTLRLLDRSILRHYVEYARSVQVDLLSAVDRLLLAPSRLSWLARQELVALRRGIPKPSKLNTD